MLVIDQFWYESPSILYRSDRLLEFFITNDQSISEKLNAICRFGIYVSIILAMYHNNAKYLALSIITFIITYFLYYNISEEKFTEDSDVKSDRLTSSKDFTKSTILNPFGNPSVINVTQSPMENYTEFNDSALKTKVEVEDNFNYNLYKDVGTDIYNKENSQRQFYTVPDQGFEKYDFKNWLYGNSNTTTCKENTYKCSKNIYEPLQSKKPEQFNIFKNPNESGAKTQ